MRKHALILTITDTWLNTARRVQLTGTRMLPLLAGERVTKITFPKHIPVRQLGLATGKVVFVRRVPPKGTPRQIEVKYYE